MNEASLATFKILINIYLATMAANIIISSIQLYDNPSRAQKYTLLNWLVLAFNTLANGFFPSNNFASHMVPSIGTMISQSILGIFLAEITGVKFSWKPVPLFFIAMALLSYALAVLPAEPQFEIYALGSVIGGVFPFFYAFFQVLRKKKEPFTTVQKLFTGTALIMSFHYLDWPYFRTQPQLLMIGFYVAFGIYHVLSVLIPMMVNEQALRVRNASLEKEVQLKVEQNKQSENINRMKDEFLAAVSHELRTPLNSIVGYSDLLQSGDLQSPEEVHEAYKIIHRSSRMQLQIVDQLLDVSSVLAGKVNFRPENLQPAQIGRDVLDEIQLLAHNRGIHIYSEIAPQLPMIFADPVRLHQICWNLLTNAIKFTSSGGWIRFTMKPQGGNLLVSIEDNGIGMDPQFLPHIFERFRQESTGNSRRFGGLGLGLAISKELVELHGGSIHAQSSGSGQGSCFSFTIPFQSGRA